MTKRTRRTLIAAATALLAAGAAQAQQPPMGPGMMMGGPRVISVDGFAEAQVKPDMALISVGVTNRAATAAAAIDQNSAAAGKIIDQAKKSGIAGDDIRTGTISLAENVKTVREPGGAVNQQPDGYVVTNVVTLRVRDLPKLGAILRDVVDQGANRINGLSFEVANPARIQDELRKEALADARRRAALLAEAAGAKLGPVRSIQDPPRAGIRPLESQPMMRMSAAAAPRADVPIAAGAITFSAHVAASWTLE